ncbi:MAG: DUF4097 family beta strand repeat protein [Candidatus Aminicenantes bacterium]|nr:DUF4097 family beta strand repeat protein [Candidatus Aminicenantes bacterium]
MKAKEIILLFLIIAAGVFLYHAYTGKLDFDFYWDEDLFFFFEPIDFEETHEIEPPFPSEIHVINRNGEVDIQGTDGEKIFIRLKKKIWRRDEEEARDVADELKMITERDQQKIVFRTNRDELRRKRFNTTFTVFVPMGTDVKIRNTYGRVKAANTGNTDIENPNGETVVTDISGTLTLDSKYEDIEITDVASNCVIHSHNCDLFLKNVGGSADIKHRYGRIELEDIKHNVTVDGSNSEISCKNVGGSVTAESSYEDILLRDTGPAVVRGSNCNIEVERIRGSCDIIDNYGRVEVSDLQGNLKIDGKNLSVFARSIFGGTIFVSTTYRDIEMEDFAGKTEIVHSNGKIFLTPAPLTSAIEVKGKYSDINLFWPKNGRYPLEAQNKGGDIKWELEEELSYHKENGITIIKAFVSETLNPEILLTTSYGTIRIEELLPR